MCSRNSSFLSFDHNITLSATFVYFVTVKYCVTISLLLHVPSYKRSLVHISTLFSQGTSVKSSSLPSRAVLCGVVFTYAALRGYLLFYKSSPAAPEKGDISGAVSLSFYLMGFGLICLAVMVTSFARVSRTIDTKSHNYLFF